MKKLVTLVAFVMAVVLPAAAHHSGAAFDRELPVQINGAVTQIVWQSPHARLHVAAKDDSGANVSWDFELPSPVTLMRRGWTRNSLKAGDVVTVTGIRARDFPHIAIATGVTDAAGKRLFSGTATPTD